MRILFWSYSHGVSLYDVLNLIYTVNHKESSIQHQVSSIQSHLPLIIMLTCIPNSLIVVSPMVLLLFLPILKFIPPRTFWLNEYVNLGSKFKDSVYRVSVHPFPLNCWKLIFLFQLNVTWTSILFFNSLFFKNGSGNRKPPLRE